MVSLCIVFCSCRLICLPGAKYSPKALGVQNTLRYLTPWGSDTAVTNIRFLILAYLPLLKNKETEHKVFLIFSLYVNKKRGWGALKNVIFFFVTDQAGSVAPNIST